MVNVEEMGKHVEKTLCTDVPKVQYTPAKFNLGYLNLVCFAKVNYFYVKEISNIECAK